MNITHQIEQKDFCNEIDWSVLVNSVPLKNQTEYYSVLLGQLKDLFEGDSKKKNDRKKDFLKVLDAVDSYLLIVAHNTKEDSEKSIEELKLIMNHLR